MYEVGRPGAFVSRQKWRRLTRGALCGAAAAALAATAAGAVAGAIGTAVPALRALVALTGAAAAAGCWYFWLRSARLLRQSRQAAIGARSERQVRGAVRRTGSIAAAYGLLLGDRAGDCDAVVFTRGCGVAVIEVKTGHGVVTVDGDTMRVGRRALHKSPTRQASNQARRLSRRLGRKAVVAVVCVPGMTNRRFTAAGVWVCGPRDLAAVLDHAPRVFGSDGEARETMKRLWHARPDEGAAGSGPVRMPEDR